MSVTTTGTEPQPLSVLMLEDSPLDADLIVAALDKGGVAAEVQRVETRPAFVEALYTSAPDLILADLALPEFDGVSALEIVKQQCPDVPFIFVSGTMGEETAIDMLKQGATDYVLKARKERLVPAVLRALTQSRERAERRRAEAALRDSESKYRRLAAQLAEADRRKDEFLAMLAHELRNPLAPIRNTVQVLRLAGGDPDTARQCYDVLDRQVGHLVRLIDDLLDISRIQRGSIKLDRRTVDLATVIANAVETSRPLIDARRHRLQVTQPVVPLFADGDQVRLTQILSNLLNNAAKYTPDGGSLWLTLERDAGYGVVKVRDDGHGIAPDMIGHVFEPFVQAERSLSRSEGGLGIGLTLVRRLTEMHGGTVEGHSDGHGKGSTFTVRLPLVDGVVPKRRVLVVDDNKDAADSLAVLLRLGGCETACAYDGHRAVELASSFAPNVVLLDLDLPGLSGFEVAAQVRAEGRVLIALTGHGYDDDRQKTAAAGFAHHLIKPVDPEYLGRLLDGKG